jgi:Alr-MurF fusion protein
MDPFDLRFWQGFCAAGGSMDHPAIIDHVVIDSRRIHSPKTLFVSLKGNNVDGHYFVHEAALKGAKYAIVKKGYSLPSPLPSLTLLSVDDPLKAFQEVAAAYRLYINIPIIAIGGSYGKTMVKDLLIAMLNTKLNASASPGSFNSQIGVPMSLFTFNKSHQIGIIEAGSSLPGEMDRLINMIQPTYGIFTLAGKKHLTTFGSIQTAAEETMKLLLAPSKEGWVMMPNDPLLLGWADQIRAQIHRWDEEEPHLPHTTVVEGELADTIPYLLNFPDGNIFQGEMKTGYAYYTNLINITSKAAWLLGIPSKAISQTLLHYNVEPMRTEIWKSSMGTSFINDVYCSDPQSIDQALKHFDQIQSNQRKIFVFGGMRDYKTPIDYTRIGHSLNRVGLDWLILFGQSDFTPLIDEVRRGNLQMEISLYPNYQEALEKIRPRVTSHDLILIKGAQKEPLAALTEIFNDSHSHNQCLINLMAISNNLSIIRKSLPIHNRLMVMVKAFAYGTDEVRMAKFLATCGVDILGVSYADEGISLKRAGVTQSIFVISAAFYEATKLVKWDFEVGVSDREVIEAIATAAAKQQKQIKVHLHINTGMGRFGCRAEDALELAQLIKRSPCIILEGLMTHFACADDPTEDPFTLTQVSCFDRVIQELKDHGITARWTHASNSSGAIRFNFPQYNMVRIGLAAYGLYASDAASKALDLQLAISLTSRIVGINLCKKGETISYGRTYMATREWEKIAVLPIGYFDGLHRSYSGKGMVIIRGKEAPMVGRICMDYMMVDVTDIPHVSIGDTALLFGEDQFGQYLSPEELAASGNSIVHELITCLGPRIPRIFVYEEAQESGARSQKPEAGSRELEAGSQKPEQ